MFLPQLQSQTLTIEEVCHGYQLTNPKISAKLVNLPKRKSIWQWTSLWSYTQQTNHLLVSAVTQDGKQMLHSTKDEETSIVSIESIARRANREQNEQEDQSVLPIWTYTWHRATLRGTVIQYTIISYLDTKSSSFSAHDFRPSILECD